MLRMVSPLLLALLLPLFLLTEPSCAKAPLNLSPQATAAWHGTRAIHALDTLRDIAIDGNMTVPPIFTTATTREVVEYHKSAITVIHAAPSGWQATVQSGLDELVKALPPAARQQFGPYVVLLKTVLKEALR